MKYLVTQHEGIAQWISENNIHYDKLVSSIEAIDVAPGDHIIGQLDIQQVKMLNRKRAQYEHLMVELPKDIAPEQVTPDLLTSLDAKLSKTYISLSGEGRLSIWKRQLKTRWLSLKFAFNELERKPIAIWFYTTASLLCFAWFGDMLSGSHLFQWLPYLGNNTPKPQEVDIIPTLISFAFYAFFSAQLIRIGKKLLPPIRKIRVTDTKKPKKVLIHTLSVYRNQPQQTEQGLWQITLPHFKQAKEETFTFSNQIEIDIEALTQLEKQGFSWNGTQLLRALNAHIEQLELLILLGTLPNARQQGSSIHAPVMKQFLASYLNSNKTAIHISPQQLDSINVNDAYLSLNAILERITQETGYSNRNFCVDITGATAAISCACAMATLHTNAQFQYVTTDGQGKVYQQDLMYMTSPAKPAP